MRYVLIAAVLFTAACSVPPMTPPPEPRAEIPESPTIKIAAPRIEPQKPIKPTQRSSPCSDIDTGDPVEDTRAKLDCMELHIR